MNNEFTPEPNVQPTVLHEAHRIVHGPRRSDYGHPLDNHTRTAEMWNQYLNRRFPGMDITAEDVCMMNILQKVARCATTGRITRDTLVDTAGYAANVEMVQNERISRTDAAVIKCVRAE